MSVGQGIVSTAVCCITPGRPGPFLLMPHPYYSKTHARTAVPVVLLERSPATIVRQGRPNDQPSALDEKTTHNAMRGGVGTDRGRPVLLDLLSLSHVAPALFGACIAPVSDWERTCVPAQNLLQTTEAASPYLAAN